MSIHPVPEDWHLAEEGKFVKRVFYSEPDAVVAYSFPTNLNNGVPQFLPYIVQYTIEKGHPIVVVTFYCKEVEKHVGSTFSEEEGIQHIHSIDLGFREIGAVKLPATIAETGELVRHAASLLRNDYYSRRIPVDVANIFRVSEKGDLTAEVYPNETGEAPLFLGNFEVGPNTLFGRAGDELLHLHELPKFDQKTTYRYSGLPQEFQ